MLHATLPLVLGGLGLRNWASWADWMPMIEERHHGGGVVCWVVGRVPDTPTCGEAAEGAKVSEQLCFSSHFP